FDRDACVGHDTVQCEHSYHTTTHLHLFFSLMLPPPPRPTLFPYTTLFRSLRRRYPPGDLPARRQLGPEQGMHVLLREQDLRRYRSEEHTSELQSQSNLVCRLLLEKKKKKQITKTKK